MVMTKIGNLGKKWRVKCNWVSKPSGCENI
jgi:hypothetical protein